MLDLDRTLGKTKTWAQELFYGWWVLAAGAAMQFFNGQLYPAIFRGLLRGDGG